MRPPARALPTRVLPVAARLADAPKTGCVILAPWLAALGGADADLASLLPVADVNGLALAGCAAAGCTEDGGPRAVAALMLADPFLRVRDAGQALRTAGIGRVANFPTVQVVDGETARALDSADLGAAREIERLAAFRRAGFSTVGFACGLEAARAMLADGASALVLHPGVALRDWRERAAAALATGRTLATLAAEATVPIFVYRPAAFGPELDQAVAAAAGEVRLARPN
jgi:predicted TIM-barrel enzyme